MIAAGSTEERSEEIPNIRSTVTGEMRENVYSFLKEAAQKPFFLDFN